MSTEVRARTRGMRSQRQTSRRKKQVGQRPAKSSGVLDRLTSLLFRTLLDPLRPLGQVLLVAGGVVAVAGLLGQGAGPPLVPPAQPERLRQGEPGLRQL